MIVVKIMMIISVVTSVLTLLSSVTVVTTYCRDMLVMIVIPTAVSHLVMTHSSVIKMVVLDIVLLDKS